MLWDEKYDSSMNAEKAHTKIFQTKIKTFRRIFFRLKNERTYLRQTFNPHSNRYQTMPYFWKKTDLKFWSKKCLKSFGMLSNWQTEKRRTVCHATSNLWCLQTRTLSNIWFFVHYFRGSSRFREPYKFFFFKFFKHTIVLKYLPRLPWSIVVIGIN